MENKLKVLWYSDSPLVPSGFGHVAKHILRTLSKSDSLDITVVGISHIFPYYDYDEFPYRIIPCHQGDMLNSANFIEQLRSQTWDRVFLFNDFQIIEELMPYVLAEQKRQHFKIIVYCPIDWEVPDGSEFSIFESADTPVVYTNWAKGKVLEVKPELKDKIQVIYHGVDRSIYHSIPLEERRESRKEIFGIDDDIFLIANVNANQWRKDWPRTLIAYRMFHEKHPNSLLYLHTNPMPPLSKINMYKQLQQCGVEEKSFLLPPEGYNAYKVSDSQINTIYNCADVVISTTLGEGWGLSCTEAMSAGTPVIMPRNTVFPEILGENEERGLLASSGHEFVICSPEDNHIRPLTDVYSMVDKLEEVYNFYKLYEAAEDREHFQSREREINRRANIAPRWLEENCDWEKIGEQWLNLFLK